MEKSRFLGHKPEENEKTQGGTKPRKEKAPFLRLLSAASGETWRGEYIYRQPSSNIPVLKEWAIGDK